MRKFSNIFHPLTVAVMLLLITGLIYSFSLKAPFYFDDIKLIKNNAAIEKIENLRYVFERDSYFRLFGQPRYRPVSAVLYIALYQLFGKAPALWRTFNILLHVINCFLLFLLLKRLKIKESIALSASLIFAVHTVHTETINVISLNPDMLGSFFCLLAVLAYLEVTPLSLVFSAVFFFLACLVKETFILLPALLFLLSWRIEDDFKWPAFLRSQAGFLIAALLFLYINFQLMKNPFSVQATFALGNIKGPLLTFSVVLVYYLRIFFLPTTLTPLYDFPVYHSFAQTQVIGSLVILFIIAIVIAYGYYRRYTYAPYLSWFFLFLLPTSNIIPFWSILADRYLYLPLMGLVTGVLLLLQLVCEKMRLDSSKILPIFTVIFVILLSSLTIARNRVWSYPPALWQDAVKKAPKKRTAAYNNLAGYYLDIKDYDSAIKVYKKAIEATPMLPKAYSNLAGTYLSIKKYALARQYYEKAVSFKYITDLELHYSNLINLGETCVYLGDYQALLKYLLQAREVFPKRAKTYYNLALVYQQLGMKDKAKEAKIRYENLKARSKEKQ